MYKLFLSTALVALFSITACNSDTQKQNTDAKSSDAAKPGDNASKTPEVSDGKTTPVSLEEPEELKQQAVDKFGEKEIKAIETVVMNMIKRNPQLFMETVQFAAQFQQEKQALEIRQLLTDNKDKLLNDEATLVSGNIKGPVELVLIADPLCPNCHTLQNILANVMKKKPELKVLTHHWAFINGGEQSSAIARILRAAYLADKQKYNNLYKAVLMLQDAPSEEKMYALVKGAGFDADKVKTTAESAEAKTSIEATRDLAKALKLPGAPILMARMPDGGLALIPPSTGEEDLLKIVMDLGKMNNASSSAAVQTSAKKSGDATAASKGKSTEA